MYVCVPSMLNPGQAQAQQQVQRQVEGENVPGGVRVTT